MGRNFKVAVLRARHNPHVDLISDEACRRAIFANRGGTAVFQYWEQVSGGFYSFTGSQLFGWTEIEIDPKADDGLARTTVYEAARAAAERKFDFDAGDFDAVLVIALPGVVNIRDDSGAVVPTNISYGAITGADPNYCVMRAKANVHTDYCHELGHTIGWEHTYGLLNNGSDWSSTPEHELAPVYGDPFDIMSSETFGSRDIGPPTYSGDATFATDPVPAAGWPDDLIWQGLGPMPAQAHLHLTIPEAFDDTGSGLVDRLVSAKLPGRGEVVRQTLHAASDAPAGATTVLALHPRDESADGRGRWYLEYRRDTGWDSGLHSSGSDLARRSVVLHQLTEVPDEGLRCWYRGRVLVPLEVDADIKLRGTPYTARVTFVDRDESSVVVHVQQSAARVVVVSRQDSEKIVSFTPQRTDSMSTVCGTFSASWGVRRVQATTTFTATSYGFGGVGEPLVDAPTIAWDVAGQPVDRSGFYPLTVAGRTVNVWATLSDPPTRLTLMSFPDDGVYSAEVTATATEADGSATASSDPQPFAVDGLRAGYDHSIQQQLTTCIKDLLNQARIRPPEIFLPPRGVATQREIDRLTRAKLNVVVQRLIRRDPTLAAELQHLTMLRYAGLP